MPRDYSWRPLGARTAATAATAAVWALLAVLTLGCATLEAMDRKDDFEIAQNYFTQYVRYGRISHAAVYIDPKQRDEFLSLEHDLTNLRFTDYDKVFVDLDEEAMEATVTMRFSGYLEPEMIERHVDFEQTWKHDEETGRWLVTLELDKIRRVLAGQAP